MGKKTGGVIIVIIAAFLLFCPVAFAQQLNESAMALTGLSGETDDLAEVKVALIDTGIETERLDGRYILDGKNYVTEAAGDLVGHGTAIASLIVGAKNGEDKITAAAPNALLVPLTYYSQYSSGVPINGGVGAISEAIYDAVDIYGCKVISISSGVTSNEPVLWNAVLYAEKNNVIVISAAGNEGTDKLYYPASYPTVVGVGSVNGSGGLSGFSQRNVGVTLCAPGEDLYAVSLKNSRVFEQFSGTSYACAFAVGAAARLLGENPDLTPAEFRWILQNTCSDMNTSGYDEATGFGLLNVTQIEKRFDELISLPPLPFRDVFAKDDDYPSISKAYDNGWLNGVSGYEFAPNESVTRAMFVTVLYRMANSPSCTENVFDDVKAEDWYYNAVSWAAKQNITNGVSDTKFCPNELLTYENAVTMLQRYAELCGSAELPEKYDRQIYDSTDADIMTRSEIAEMIIRFSDL